MLKFKEIKVD